MRILNYVLLSNNNKFIKHQKFTSYFSKLLLDIV